MSSSSEAATKPVPPPGPARMPSLNQLAARIKVDPNVAAQSSTASPSATRPRLAAFALRTGSNASISTTASTQDSVAVNVSTTRAASPSGMTPPPGGTPTNETPGSAPGQPLTEERLDKLNELVPPEKGLKPKVGYKNIPSLDAITARLAKNRALSVDGTPKPPEPEMMEDPKTPGIQVKKPEHPLQYTWTMFHDTKNAKFPHTPAPHTPQPPASAASDTTSFHQTESTDYEAGLTVVGTFDTVEEFCRYFNWLKPPSHLERNSNYHLFKAGIKPMWEDPANANGGKWVLTMKNNPQLLDRCWNWLVMALVGEELEENADEICGAVVSLRAKVDRIQVWTRGKDDVERLNGIGKKLVKLLDISEADGIGLEFQFNTEDRPQPNKFLSIQAVPPSGFRNSFHAPPGGVPFHPPRQGGSPDNSAVPVAPSPVGGNANVSAFGQFGVGTNGPGWRVPKRG